MNKEEIFSKIVKKEIFADIVYQDDLVTAFKDIKPKAPIHILIIPNIFISTVNDIKEENKYLFGHMIFIASRIAFNNNISDKGYRIILNCNKDGGQDIFYVHMHLIGGCNLDSILNF